jgi:hypothetical protein
MIEITLNPDILPTKEEWILVCKMIKKQRELTDEEIIEVWDEYYEDIDIITFARAILKKESE